MIPEAWWVERIEGFVGGIAVGRRDFETGEDARREAREWMEVAGRINGSGLRKGGTYIWRSFLALLFWPW